MRIPALILAAALGLAGCATQEVAVTQCTEPRPSVCTREYAPVCGQLSSGERETYSSPCNACAHDLVVAYTPGACPDAP